MSVHYAERIGTSIIPHNIAIHTCARQGPSRRVQQELMSQPDISKRVRYAKITAVIPKVAKGVLSRTLRFRGSPHRSRRIELLIEKLRAAQQVGNHGTPGADGVMRVGGRVGNIGATGIGLPSVEPLLRPRLGDDARE